MKKHALILVVVLSLVLIFYSCSKEIKLKEKFSSEPSKPRAGDEITVIYNPDSSGLKDASQISMVAYFYSEDLDDTKQVEMAKTLDGWKGRFTTSDSTKGILIKFKSGEDIDNNQKQGFLIHLYDAEGNILPGSYAGYASALYSWGSYYLDMDRNLDSSLYYFRKEFAKNPELKYEYMDPYLNVETRLNKDNEASIIIRELSGLYTKAASVKDYSVLAKWYDKADMQNRADIYKKILEDKYPGSDFVQREKYETFYNETDIKKKLKLLEEFESAYPESKYLSNFYDLIARYYLQNDKYYTLKDFMERNVGKPSTYRFYSVATTMLNNDKNPGIALDIAQLGVDRARSELNSPTEKKPNYLSEQEWKEDRNTMLGMNLFAYADALFKLGKADAAEAPLKEAKDLTEGKDENINQLYAKVLVANGKDDEAMREIESHIREGKATPTMKSMLKDLYTKKNGTSDGFDSYIAQFESVAKQLLVARLEKQIMNRPAPDFTLKDLDGKKVSLAKLKGKTVIIDFWATWCGPCKASFPGMQKAIEQYKDNENVAFLFVNSWENSEDKAEKAREFITEKNYPFHVLLDEDNKVIGDYHVSGIPTKFIVDKNGHIRFMKVGFSGNTDEMVDEISTMISMVN